MKSFDLEDLHRTVLVDYRDIDVFTRVSRNVNVRFRPECVRRDSSGRVVVEGENVGTYARLAIPLKDVLSWEPLS